MTNHWKDSGKTEVMKIETRRRNVHGVELAWLGDCLLGKEGRMVKERKYLRMTLHEQHRDFSKRKKFFIVSGVDLN